MGSGAVGESGQGPSRDGTGPARLHDDEDASHQRRGQTDRQHGMAWTVTESESEFVAGLWPVGSNPNRPLTAFRRSSL